MKMKIRVHDTINLEPLNPNFRLTKSVRFSVDKKNFFIPRGFKTNLGSVPRILRAFVSPCGRLTESFVLHDYYYASESNDGEDRKYADKVLLNSGIENGVNKLKCYAVYYSVRAFGWMFYKKSK